MVMTSMAGLGAERGLSAPPLWWKLQRPVARNPLSPRRDPQQVIRRKPPQLCDLATHGIICRAGLTEQGRGAVCLLALISTPSRFDYSDQDLLFGKRHRQADTR
jgi:hypothetical protein